MNTALRSSSLAREIEAPSLFLPENMLREARRQRGLAIAPVPEICVLDPDGDLAAFMVGQHGATSMAEWACYHSELLTCDLPGVGRVGVVGKVVGAPYAVLVAELLFASGCRFLVSLSSAGQIAAIAEPPYFVLIDRALRDEGTSAHYLPPSEEVTVNADLLEGLARMLRTANQELIVGGSWTTDAPFRETERAVAHARSRGLLVVEMEAAGLYAFARARRRDVVCLAHVTNRLGEPGDFEKGIAGGATEAFALIRRLAVAWQARPTIEP
jgi:uridine phosphorylase